MSALFSIVPKSDILAIWLRVCRFIEIGYAEADEYMPVDIVDRLRHGSMALWVVANDNLELIAAMVTELELRPSGMACRMTACGGSDMETWGMHQEKILEYAKAQGCVKVVTGGRCGWEKVLNGFKRVRVTLERAVL